MKIQNRDDISNIPADKLLTEEHHAVSANGTPIVIGATTINKQNPRTPIAKDQHIILGRRLDADNKIHVGYDPRYPEQGRAAIEAVYDMAYDDAKFRCAVATADKAAGK